MRAPGPFRTLGGRRFDLRSLGQDLPLKAVAVAVALVLWVTVVQAAAREVDQEFAGIAIERPELPEGYVLRGALGEVTVQVRGTQTAIGAIGREQLHATIEVSLLAAGPEPQDAPVRVTVDSETAKVISATPATVQVRVERVTTRALGVQARFANEPPAGSVPGQAAVTPAEVTISGPESAVASVAAVYATVRFGDVGIDVVQTVQATAVDADGVTVEGVVAQPEAVEVRVPLLPTSTTRTLPVLWTFRGQVAPGFWISQVTSDPVAVTVQGAPGALGPLELIATAPIDVSGLNASRTVRVPLTLPAGVALLKPGDASVTVTVVPLAGTRPFPLVAIQAIGLSPDRTALPEPRTVVVVLSGQIAALLAVTADQVTATVDVTGREPGLHQLDVVVRAPNGTVIDSVQPARATVTITQR